MADKEAAPKTAKARVVSKYPDVCNAPIPPTPFKIYALYEDHVDFSNDVNVTGVPATTEKSRISKCYGDEAGTGKGVKSGSQLGWCRPIDDWSPTVQVNGNKILRHDTKFGMNAASKDGPYNTEGRTVYDTGAPLASISVTGRVLKDTNPLVKPTPKEQSWLDQAGKWAADNKVLQRGAGLVQAGFGALQVTAGVGGLLVPSGVSQVVGGIAVLHGMDDISTGVSQALSGQSEKTLTEQAGTAVARGAGADENTAEAFGRGVDMLGGSIVPVNVAARAAAEAGEQGLKTGVKATGQELAKEGEQATKQGEKALAGEAEQTAEATAKKRNKSDGAKIKKKSRAELKEEENNKAIDDYLEGKGKKVEDNPREGQEGAGRQGDRFVDGVKTEYKTLDPGATPNTIRNQVNNSIRGGGQARDIVIDARNTDLAAEQAAEGISKAMGISRGMVDNVTVIGKGYEVSN